MNARSGRAALVARVVICAAAAAGLLAGWRLFWFQCDDAYIAYRYVSASQLGWGYTWNPPPFRPVEGYTSFLWVVMLDVVWRVLGVEPPQAANWLSLAFSAGSLALVVTMALRMRLSPGLVRWRTSLLAMVLLAVLTNRTFLAWTSSGLETSLFGFLLLAWVALALFSPGDRRSLALLSLTAALLALARPDGLLFIVGTAGILTARLTGAREISARALAPLLPLAIPIPHLLWRRATYGYWLPNTYYAKHIEAWPEAGVRYFAAFALEYAYWIWLALAFVALARMARGGLLLARLRAGDPTTATALGVGVTLGLHFAYYTFLVGGDHFEFRVYQHWVVLVPLFFAAVAERAGLTPRRAFAALGAMILLGWPLPWIHWWHTHTLTLRPETHNLAYPVSAHLPAGVRWYGEAWDGLQAWMIQHGLGIRHQEHKVFHEEQSLRFPERAEGALIGPEGYPVMPFNTVGVPGWRLPYVAIIDTLGLNDAVIAHSGQWRTGDNRYMAHDRRPPEGYVLCFRPNVFALGPRGIKVVPRDRPLTAEEIRSCEERFRQ